MHIVIPMSGVGQRFIDAGYKVPKPLIEVEGKPIIQHVVELFPGEDKFTFICNEQHLATTEMRKTLLSIVPNANIVSIAAHKLGPVHAVAQIFDSLLDDEEVIVNYCDFGTYWNYSDFLDHTRHRDADGAIPAYRGFHPHMLGTTNYAFMREKDQWMLEIQEKQPFTENRMQEFASNGTYYFKSGALVKKYFSQLMDEAKNLGGEYYVSLAYNLLKNDGLNISIYKIQHMLQWGTPGDIEEYNMWSNYFRQAAGHVQDWTPRANSATVIPMAGRGARFSQKGYSTPKPLIDVSGKPMIVQAISQLPESEKNVFVCLQSHLEQYAVDKALLEYDRKATIIPIEGVTAGQAITCNIGICELDDECELLIGPCDNGLLWDAKRYQALLEDPECDAVIWTFKNHPASKRQPEMYGWVKVDGNNAREISVKVPISDTPEKDNAVIGSFYFKKVKMFKQALHALLEKNITINGEYYVDSMMQEMIELGYRVKVFDVDHYLGWGTPDDYETYCYWQSYFHKDAEHPYSISSDANVNAEEVERLSQEASTFEQEAR